MTEAAADLEIKTENEPKWRPSISGFNDCLDEFRSRIEQQLNIWLDSVYLAFTFLATAVVCGVFVLILEPLSSIFVESRSVRYKLQGYFAQAVEKFVELRFNQAFEYEVTGDALINPENLAAVISNHQGLLDYFTLMSFASRCGLDNSNFFFVWKHCVRLPSIQVLYNAWRNKSNWRVPKIVLSDVFCPVLESPWRDQGGKWIVIFPEVIPWSNTSMLEHRAECSDNGCPKLQNLLYPRFNAFNQTVSFLRDHPLADVYDLTILYVNTNDGSKIGMPTWREIMFSQKQWKVCISVKKIPTSQVPHKEKHMTRWLEKQWYLKDEEISLLKKEYSSPEVQAMTEKQKLEKQKPEKQKPDKQKSEKQKSIQPKPKQTTE